MNFTVFDEEQREGYLLTKEHFEDIIGDPTLNVHYKNIFKAERPLLKQALISQLPTVTWQCSGGKDDSKITPSGLFVLEVKNIPSWGAFYRMRVSKVVQKCGIVYSAFNVVTGGLTVVAKCRPSLHTLLECQRWLAAELKVPSSVDENIGWTYENVLVPDDFVLYYNDAAMFDDEPIQGSIYVGGSNNEQMEPLVMTPQVESAVVIMHNNVGVTRVVSYGYIDSRYENYSDFTAEVRNLLNL